VTTIIKFIRLKSSTLACIGSISSYRSIFRALLQCPDAFEQLNDQKTSPVIESDLADNVTGHCHLTMFVISEVLDTIGVLPRDQGLKPSYVLLQEINRKYANKVLHGVGLCICVWDLVDCSEGTILYGDGTIYYKVIFNLAVFRPAKGEVIEGSVKSQSEKGVKISMGFFDDIIVPPRCLPDKSFYDLVTSRWYWVPPRPPEDEIEKDDTRTDGDNKFFLDKNDLVRVKVEDDIFNETGPKQRPIGPRNEVDEPSPYTVLCTMQAEGLGAVEWWTGLEE